MNELSESIYLRTGERSDGVEWLKTVGLAGYVLEPRGEWLQIFPGWDVDNRDKKRQALEQSTGLVVHYYYNADQLWSVAFFDDGEFLLCYECAFDEDHCTLDGRAPEEIAGRLGVGAGKLNSIFDVDNGGASWQELADDAAKLADLLALPNYAFASYRYANMDAEATGMADFFVDIDDGDEEDDDTEDRRAPAIDDLEAPPAQQSGDGNAPWQAAYDLASHFLKHLHDDELIELTLDTRLARDRLIERLTRTVIENPISSDDQVVSLWLDNLMDAPEIVDIFATDDMLADAFQSAKEETIG